MKTLRKFMKAFNIVIQSLQCESQGCTDTPSCCKRSRLWWQIIRLQETAVGRGIKYVSEGIYLILDWVGKSYDLNQTYSCVIERERKTGLKNNWNKACKNLRNNQIKRRKSDHRGQSCLRHFGRANLCLYADVSLPPPPHRSEMVD